MTDQTQTTTNQRMDLVQIDYEQTMEQFKVLADIRFKLIAIVPILTGTAIAFFAGANLKPYSTLPLGILGFIATLGMIIYELRNTLYYEMCSTRAVHLESLLRFPRFSELPGNSTEPGGVFTERYKDSNAPQQNLAGIIPVRHHIGLSLIYGASLAGWSYIIANALPINQGIHLLITLILPTIIFLLTVVQFDMLAKQRFNLLNNNRTGKEIIGSSVDGKLKSGLDDYTGQGR